MKIPSSEKIPAAVAEEMGRNMVDLFGLKPLKEFEDSVRYDTSWGTKTLEGVGRCVLRIVRELK